MSAAKPQQDSVPVGKRRIGPGEDLFVIAEIGLNHNQDLSLARELVDAAAEAGCAAAKFQTFRADDVYVAGARAGTYQLMGREIPIYDLHKGLEMSAMWVDELQSACAGRGLEFFSAPIGTRALDLLDNADVPAHKISSYELTNLPFVAEVAAKGRSMIMSTGAANLGEIQAAVDVVRQQGCPLALMQCVTQYPAPYSAANLAVMDTLRACFGVPVGFSDNGFAEHDSYEGPGQELPRDCVDASRVPEAAAAAGADLFEIHITLDRGLPGPDHGFATEPDELKRMVTRMNTLRSEFNLGVRNSIDAELWGSPQKRTLAGEQYVREFAFKGLFAVRDIRAGELLTRENVRALRPGEGPQGIAPRYLETVAGVARATSDLGAWEPLTWAWLLA